MTPGETACAPVAVASGVATRYSRARVG